MALEFLTKKRWNPSNVKVRGTVEDSLRRIERRCGFVSRRWKRRRRRSRSCRSRSSSPDSAWSFGNCRAARTIRNMKYARAHDVLTI